MDLSVITVTVSVELQSPGRAGTSVSPGGNIGRDQEASGCWDTPLDPKHGKGNPNKYLEYRQGRQEEKKKKEIPKKKSNLLHITVSKVVADTDQVYLCYNGCLSQAGT